MEDQVKEFTKAKITIEYEGAEPIVFDADECVLQVNNMVDPLYMEGHLGPVGNRLGNKHLDIKAIQFKHEEILNI